MQTKSTSCFAFEKTAKIELDKFLHSSASMRCPTKILALIVGVCLTIFFDNCFCDFCL